MRQILDQIKQEVPHPEDDAAIALLKIVFRFDIRCPLADYYKRTETPEELEDARAPFYKRYACNGKKPETSDEWTHFYDRFIADIQKVLEGQRRITPVSQDEAYAK